MPRKSKKVSVIISSRNEEGFIGRCLDSLVAQSYPKTHLEVLVADASSDDRTREIVRSCAKKYPFIKLLERPREPTAHSFNAGIKNAAGDIIMFVGAHGTYAPRYVEKSVKYLEEYNADNVGGVLKTLPADNTRVAKAIALVLSSFFGAGNALFRTGVVKPQEADTVFGGCYRKEVFQKIGLFNENLVRSQDMELNLRLKRAGGKIIVAPDIVGNYYPKATLKEFFRHNIADGTWAILPLKFGAKLFRLRHLVPLIFMINLIGTLFLSIFSPLFLYIFVAIAAAYGIASLLFSFQISIKEGRLTLIPLLMAAFAVRHFGYGLGSLIGLIKLVL